MSGWFHALMGAGKIETQFRNRVLSDNGVFEGLSCLESIISEISVFFSQASWMVTPNAYKTSKLYSVKPTDGSGDLVFTRSSSVSTRKTSTLVETVPTNLPRLDYVNVSCPSILLEPDRTNLLLRSEDLNNSAWNLKIGLSQLFNISPFQELLGANGIYKSGNYIYVAANTSDCLEIIGVSDPANPVHVGKISNGGSALLNGPIGVYVSGNYAYVTSNLSNAVEIIDISTPSSPTHAASISNGGGGGAGAALSSPWNMDIVGTNLYVVSNHALEIINISNPLVPTHIGKITSADAPFNTPTDVKVVGNYAYIPCLGNDTFVIINISTPSSPTLAGSITHGTGGALLDGCHGVYVSGNYAYVCSRESGALEILDISNPASPTHAASLTGLTGSENIEIVGSYAYIACLTGDMIAIINVSNPLSPSLAGTLPHVPNRTALDGVNRIVVSGNYAYVASIDSNGVEIADISNPSVPTHVSKLISYDFIRCDIRESAINNVHLVRQTLIKAASALPYVCAFVLKGGLGRDYALIQAHDGTNIVGRFFNLSTGALGGTRLIGSGFSLDDSRIINLGNEGYLCIIKVTSTTSTSFNFDLLLSTDGSTITYLGDVTKGVYAAMPYVIQASSPLTNTYVKTVTTSLARGDSDSITALTGVSSLIGQLEGTIFLWINRTNADSTSKAVSISDGTGNNRVIIDFTTGNVINTTIVSGGVTQANISNASFANLTEYKVAVTYQNNKAALFVNGTKIGEDLTVVVPACSRIGFDSGGLNPFYGNIELFGISKIALNDADAQVLTTI